MKKIAAIALLLFVALVMVMTCIESASGQLTRSQEDKRMFWKGLPSVYVTMVDTGAILDTVKKRISISMINGTGTSLSTFAPGELWQSKGTINIRGNFTATLPKKPYTIAFTNDTFGKASPAPVFGLPPHTKWTLLAQYQDNTKLADIVGGKLAVCAGQAWASRGQPVRLYLDSAFAGLYLWMEKIEVDTARINISGIKKTDTAGAGLTGGYVWERLQPGYVRWNEVSFTTYKSELFSYKVPDATDVKAAQNTYSKNYWESFYSATESISLSDTTTGYRHYIDAQSFATYYISKDLEKDPDSYIGSWYITKPKSGKMIAGPVWDHGGLWPVGAGVMSYTNTTVDFSDPNDTYLPVKVPYYATMMGDNYFASLVREQYKRSYPEICLLLSDFKKYAAKLYATGVIDEEKARWPLSTGGTVYLADVDERAQYGIQRAYWQYRHLYNSPTLKTVN